MIKYKENRLAKIYEVLISNQAALVMFLIIQSAQALHTAYVLFELTSLPFVLRFFYSVMAAIGIELIIVSLIGRGRVETATYYKYFYFLMNLYAFHLRDDVYFFSFEMYENGYSFINCLGLSGFFAIIPSYFLPLAGEQLSKELTKENPRKLKRKRRTKKELMAAKVD